MRLLVCVAAVAMAASMSVTAQEGSGSLDTPGKKMGYSIGFQFGQFLKGSTDSVDMDALMRAMNDVIDGKDLAMTDDDMRAAFQQFQQIAQAAAQRSAAEASKDNIAAGEAYLAENAKRDGVKVTDSGLQYEELKKGTGATPEATSTVVTHYRGTLIDGTEFDSSYKRGEPAEFPVNRVIPGWTEALQLMKTGAKWKLYIPQELAYGPQGNQGIPGGSALIFEIELLEIK
jgi:FKBP-type peptidyl-prolyl cis-trans isomerase FklB